MIDGVILEFKLKTEKKKSVKPEAGFLDAQKGEWET
jgi:hypothetical protein